MRTQTLGHNLRFVLRSYIEHRNPENLKLHVWSHGIGWIALTTALSQMPLPLPFDVPLFGANAGTAFILLSALYWIRVDVLVTLAVLALSAAWSLSPLWGPGNGWLGGVALPLAVLAVTEITAKYAHVYHHEHSNFLKGGHPLAEGLQRAHAMLWGPFHLWLVALLRRGYRPALKTELDRQERRLLRTRLDVPWNNWAKLTPFSVRYVCVPESIEDLRDAVLGARERGQRVRVVASGFTWSSLVPSDETLIFCERLDRISVDASDPQHPTVWVEAGVTNRQLNRELARHGLCMPWNVVLENVRLAGIASTGTHGTGRGTSTVGDLVEALEIFDANGKFRVLSEETVGPEIMSAARLGLGLFGVIARIKLRVVPLYRVRQTDTRLPVKDMLERLPELVKNHDSVELYWFPFNREMWMRTIDRTEEPRTFHGHGLGFKTQNFLQNAWLAFSAPLVDRYAPSLTKTLLRIGLRVLPYRARVLDLPDSHHYHHWIEMMPATGCMEVGFKADPDLANVLRAWETTERLVEKYEKRGLYPLNLTLNVRFIGSSSTLLTPAYGEGMTCYAEIMWMGRPQGWKEFTSELCREWLKEPGALPHWSKEFEHVEDVVSIMRANLGDRRQRFLDALAKSGVDPKRAFFNRLTSRVLIDE